MNVVMFSGGVGSWATAKRVAERHGTDDLVLLFADTKVEDPDLYRFRDEAAFERATDCSGFYYRLGVAVRVNSCKPRWVVDAINLRDKGARVRVIARKET